MSQQSDPESPSPSLVSSSERHQAPPLADKKTRLITYVIDCLMLGIMDYILILLVTMVGGTGAVEKLNNVPGLILGIALTLLFYVTQESLLGRTVGKIIMGTRVVDYTGRHPTFSRILLRTFCRFIPFEQFSFLFAGGRGWHDRFSGTYVINTRA